MAERLWPGGDALGGRVRGAGEATWLTVVGVVGDVRHYGPGAPARPEVYIPYSAEYLTSKAYVVRSERADPALGDRIRDAITAVAADQPIREIRSMGEWSARATAGPRFQALAMTLAAALATALAAVGLFGVLAGLVRARTPELAVRMALGAPRGSVLSLVLARAGRLVVPGVLGGVALALVFGDVLEGFLLGVSVLDPGVITGATLLFLLVGGAAALLPARRATSLDTARVLRQE
jgi:predicted lysophospholipase L1 biosynthesis ABC-type transport system permease subunit